MGNACSTPGMEDNTLKSFDGQPQGQRKLGRTGLRWNDDIKIYLKEIRCKDLRVNEGYLDQDTDHWKTRIVTVL